MLYKELDTHNITCLFSQTGSITHRTVFYISHHLFIQFSSFSGDDRDVKSDNMGVLIGNEGRQILLKLIDEGSVYQRR